MLKNPNTKYKSFVPINLKSRTWADKVLSKAPIWCSVDLRDGNQALIEPMDIERKILMFKQLVKIGFKEIEVGFPSASQIEFDFVRKLIDENLIPDDVKIQVLTQARKHLIEKTFESLVGVKQAIVHFYNATAPVMRKVVLGMNENEIIELAKNNAQLLLDLSKKYPQTNWTFEYSPEMYSGTELEFSLKAIDIVTEVWQSTKENPCIINLPATVEHSTPNIFADMVEWTSNNIQRRKGVILSIHPHNDRGTGVAAAEFAIMAGADRLEGCLFGNGERTGNLDLVNIALNLYTQGINPNLDFSDIDSIKQTFEHCNQILIHPRHPYVGDLVFTSFSGSHQDAIKKAFSIKKSDDFWQIPYLPIDPQDLGRSYEAIIRVNSQSGKGGISYLLEKDYGISMPKKLQIEFSQIVQKSMDKVGTEFTSKDLWQIFQEEYKLEAVQHLHYQLSENEGIVNLQAEFVLNNEKISLQGQGNGAIDAFVSGLSAKFNRQLKVMDYHEHAMNEGTNAKAVAYLELLVDDNKTFYGVGIDRNIVSASIKSVISGFIREVK